MKKAVTLLLTMVLLLGSFANHSVKAKGVYADVPNGAWYESALRQMTEEGMFKGYEDGKFYPKNELTVVQLVTLLVRAHTKGQDVELTKPNNKWYSGYTSYAKSVNLITATEYADDQFLNSTVSRETMAMLCARYLRQKEIINDNLLNKFKDKFSDYNSIMEDKRKDVLACVTTGLLSGYPDGTFQPKKILNRAEAVIVMRNILYPSLRKPVMLSENERIIDGFIYSPKKNFEKSKYSDNLRIDQETGLNIVHKFLDNLTCSYDKKTGQVTIEIFAPTDVWEGVEVYYLVNDTKTSEYFYATDNDGKEIPIVYGQKNTIAFNIGSERDIYLEAGLSYDPEGGRFGSIIVEVDTSMKVGGNGFLIASTSYKLDEYTRYKNKKFIIYN